MKRRTWILSALGATGALVVGWGVMPARSRLGTPDMMLPTEGDVALNGWIHVGWNAPFPCHAIEHVLSAHYDISHGAGLSIVSPAWMRFVVGTRGPGKWVGFARRVMGVVEPDDAAAAVAGIDRLETFFKSLKLPTRLSDVRIPAADVGRLAEDTMRVFGVAGLLAGRPALSTADIQTILNSVR